MPNFQAKTKPDFQADALKAGEKPDKYQPEAPQAPAEDVPCADSNGFVYTGIDGFFQYRAPFEHTKDDVFRDDYFTNVMLGNRNSFLGALILCEVKNGHHDPERWATGFLRVVQVRGTRGVDPHQPTRVVPVRLWS